MAGGSVEALAWDSQWLGFPVARFAGAPPAAGGVAAAVRHCREAGVRLLYLILDPTDAAAARAARAAGAWLADSKLTYELPLLESAPPAAVASKLHLVRARVPTPELEALARQSGEHSRFRRDARIGTPAFHDLFARWLRQALAQGVVWAATTADDETVGFLAFGEREGPARIELLAVAPAARRRGVAQQLVQAAEFEARRRGHAGLLVATQEANGPARHFYERCGFRLRHTEHVYHLWL